MSNLHFFQNNAIADDFEWYVQKNFSLTVLSWNGL